MDNNSIDAHTHNKNSIQENVNRIASAKNWNALLRKEALFIHLQKTILSSGLKASKELQLFN